MLLEKLKKLFNKIFWWKKSNLKRKHRILFLTFLPLSTLFLGGTTCGILAATTNLFSSRITKTNIKNVFSQDATHWQNDITSIVTSGGFSGDGYVWNTTSTPINKDIIKNSDVITWLKIFSDSTLSSDVIDNITCNIPSSQSNNSWIRINIITLTHSRKYEGSFDFYVYIQQSDQGQLNVDFTNVAIDMISITSPNVSIIELFNAIKTVNSSLNINAVKLQYDADSSVSENWQDWTETENFGIGDNANIGQEKSLLCWSLSNDRYEHIRLVSGGTNPTYYENSNPINFTLKLFRPEIKSVTGWKNSWTGEFHTTPNSDSFLTKFDTLYSGQTWFDNKLSNDYYDTYSFANIDSTKGTFNIIGNPFYKTIISTTDVDYDFAWSFYNKVNISTLIIKEDNSQINDLDNIFYQKPIDLDVIQALKVRIKLSIVDTIAWNQISIVITDSDITLKGISSSVLYTENEKIITYRLQT